MRRAGALLATAVAALVLVACGGDDGGDADSAADPQAQMEELQSCLAEQGVEMPTPGGAPPAGDPGDSPPQVPSGGPPEISTDQMKAFEECSQFAPSGGPPADELPGGVDPLNSDDG